MRKKQFLKKEYLNLPSSVNSNVFKALTRSKTAELKRTVKFKDNLSEVRRESMKGRIPRGKLSFGFLKGKNMKDGPVLDVDLKIHWDR